MPDPVAHESIRTVPAKVRTPAPAGLPRERLEASLARIDEYRLGLVVAPAGSGKTTLLSRFAVIVSARVAWYRAEIWDSDERALVAHLGTALRAAVARFEGTPGSVDELLQGLEAIGTEPLVLVIDDLHALEGSPAERALERFVDYAPASLTVLAASRTQPGFNLPRWRVSGGLLEIGADDLRFRPWEVERLFRDHYLQQVPPQELALLASRTEGWAAGLQLFHLATRGKSPDERRRILRGVTTGSRLTREYLTRNVLADLSDELRTFLIETSVLGRLSGPLCDDLLEVSGSRSKLEELERRQIFTTQLDEDATYRYHEVLRSHLLALLIESHGEEAARRRHVRAGRLLEATGAMPEALSAYCHGEDWPAVERLLGQTGELLGSGPAGWLDALPSSLVRHDPWLILASARRARGEGRWPAAVEAYARAEESFGSAAAALTCRRERIALVSWLDSLPYHGPDWTGLLRSVTVRDPMAARRQAVSSNATAVALVAGLAALAAGHVRTARDDLRRTAEDETTSPLQAAAAAVGEGIAWLLGADESGIQRIELGIDAAERLGVHWLARLGRAAIAIEAGEETEVTAALGACRADGDAWGEALINLLQAALAIDETELSLAAAQRAGAGLRGLGAGTLEAWAVALEALALARQGLPGARAAALRAETFARSVAAAGPRGYALHALELADPARFDDYRARAAAVESETGLRPPPVPDRGSDGTPPVGDGREATEDQEPVVARNGTRRPAPVAIASFGGFSLSIRGRAVDLSWVKPRARALLRYLTLHLGTPIHREVLTEALWPEGDRDAAARSLHVALSTLRHLLEPGVGRGDSSFILRDGDAYRLELPAGSAVDFLELEHALAEGQLARGLGDTARAIAVLQRGLELYQGDLLPEDGPADWAVERREQLRSVAVEAAQSLAELHLANGEPDEAARACAIGLAADRYHDPLWRLLIQARDGAGDQGAAGRAQHEYAVMLAELGVAASDGIGVRPAPSGPIGSAPRQATNGAQGPNGAHGTNGAHGPNGAQRTNRASGPNGAGARGSPEPIGVFEGRATKPTRPGAAPG